MTVLKLAQLPDRTPIRLTISLLPDLHQALQDYAALYARTYEREISIGDLVPAILASFIEGDRAFKRRGKGE